MNFTARSTTTASAVADAVVVDRAVKFIIYFRRRKTSQLS